MPANSTLSLVHLSRPATTGNSADRPPLLVLLHGVRSNERDLFDLASYLDPRFTILSVRAPVPLGPDAYGWYPLHWTATGPQHDPDRARQSRDALVQFLLEAATAYNTDPQRIYLMGFSQGAILSLYVTLTSPESVTAIVPMSGRLLPQAWAERVSDDRLSSKPIFAVHGTRDGVLPIRDGREIRDKLSTLPVALSYREYDMAHQVSSESLGDITAWLTSQLEASGSGPG